MGAGKSVLLNSLNLAFCLRAGLKKLPLVSIIDVGPSSKGLIDLLRAALPENRKHEAVFHRLRLTKEHSVNPFDTPLGLRYPLPGQMNFLVNLLSLFATPVGAAGPPTGAGGLLRIAIEGAYRERDLRGTVFSRDKSPELFELLESLGMEMDSDTTVWEGVDFLFESGYRHQAFLLQRMAVPVLEDVVTQIRQNPSIKATYDYKVEGTGENMKDYVWRTLTEAGRDYPILSRPTRFSLGDSRVTALDLDEVAPRGGGAYGNRQTAVMYMLARYLLGARFFMMPEDVSLMPERYKEYHRLEIEGIRLDPKRLCYDELHRVTGERAVRDQLAGDLETSARESRKWNLSIGLYSQSIKDFPEVIMELATAVFLLGAGTFEGAKQLSATFGLEGSLKEALSGIGKPGPDGAEMIAIFKTRGGASRQLLVNTLSPELLWAFSTTTEDVALRNALYQRYGTEKALKVLSEKYPGGVKREVERRKSRIKAGDPANATGKGVLGELVEELSLFLEKGGGLR
jgi:intracellular multiplication protein IcmB